MSISGRIGGFLQSKGGQLVQKELEAKYGQQIGKVANNGSKTFRRKEGNTIITTGMTWDNKVIAEVTQKGNKVSGTAKKIKFNRDGDIIEVSHSRRATNFRNNVTTNLETGEVKSNVLTSTRDGKSQYQITTTVMDESGKMTTSTRDVEIKGKNSPIENV